MDATENGCKALDRTAMSATTDPVAETAIPASDINLTGIDPVHWAETRERVAILRAWCANARHTRDEALAAAERMGTTVSHFYRLVATWKKFHDVRRVSGHPSRRGDKRDTRSIRTDAQAIIGRVIDEQGAKARFTDVRAQVNSACAAAGVTAPSSGLVHKTMMRARQSAAGEATGEVDDVALASVSCLLPVNVDGGTVESPDLVLAVERPSGIIVGHRLVTDGDATAKARELLAGLVAPIGGNILVAGTIAGAVDRDTDEVGRGAASTGNTHACGHDARIEVVRRSALLSTTLGSYIDSIPIRHRRHPGRAPGPWRPLFLTDAVAAVELAVAAHNAARRG